LLIGSAPETNQVVYLYNISDGTLIWSLANPDIIAGYSDFYGTQVKLTETHSLVVRGYQSAEGGKAFLFLNSTGAYLRSFSVPYGAPSGGPWPTFTTNGNIESIDLNSQYVVIGHSASGSYDGTTSTSYDFASLLVIFDLTTGLMIKYFVDDSAGMSSMRQVNINDLNDIFYVKYTGAGYFGIASKVTSTFNNSTKVLTLSGSRLSINTALDQITYVPQTGYTDNFILTYSATRNSNGFVSQRTQNINRV
jgi:hypothetical protein